MPKRSKSSERWLQRQRKDYFVRKAQDGGQVSRAHYKLAQIDQRFHILSARKKVLELGAAPGGWTQYLEGKITRGFLIAVDPLPITRGGRCRVIEGYAGEPEVNEQINELLQGQQLDLVLSDMAPNISGVRAVDQARAMDLADIALQACEDWLANGGDLAIKAFQGEGLDAWVVELKHQFGHVNMMKPKASRPESREVFVVARGFQGGAKTNT
jgi:23S rRNA (uridine2552-2'-O)-methyltransferase